MFRWRRPIVRGVMVRVFAGSINYRRSLDGIISSLVLSFLLMCGAAVWLTFNVADVLTGRLGGEVRPFAGSIIYRSLDGIISSLMLSFLPLSGDAGVSDVIDDACVLTLAFAGGINYRRLLDEALSSLVLSFLLMYGLPGWLTLSTLLTS